MIGKCERQLTPIIVTSHNLEIAREVVKLRDIFDTTPHDDAHTLAYLIQNSDVHAYSKKIYAIVSAQPGGQTGIFVDSEWQVT